MNKYALTLEQVKSVVPLISDVIMGRNQNAVRKIVDQLKNERIEKIKEVWIKRFEEAEESFAEQLAPFFGEQIDSAVKKLEGVSIPSEIDDDKVDKAAEKLTKQIFNPRDWDDPLIDLALPILAEEMSITAVDMFDDLGLDVKNIKTKLLIKESTATEWLASEGLELPPGIDTEMPLWMQEAIEIQLRDTFAQDYWRKVGDTTFSNIDTQIRNGLIDGLSIEDMAKQMTKGLGGEYDLNRARTIARTETGNALNGARSLSINALKEELGEEIPIKQSWLSVLGNTTRDSHANLDGVPEDENGLFNLSGFDIPWPAHFSLPPSERSNCQCTLTVELGMTSAEAQPLIDEANERTERARREREEEAESDSGDVEDVFVN